MDPVDLDNTIITMQTDSGDDKRKTRSGHSKADAVFSKIKEILQDKRDTFEDDRGIAVSSSTSILKRILNIIFLATGIVLLVGVLVVIIYTSFGRPGTRTNDRDSPRRSQKTANRQPAVEKDISDEKTYQMVPSVESQTEYAQYKIDKYDHIPHYEYVPVDRKNMFIKQDLPDINNDGEDYRNKYTYDGKKSYRRDPTQYEYDTDFLYNSH